MAETRLYGIEKSKPMTEQKQITVDVEQVLRAKMGGKAALVPRFAVNWLKRIIHQDQVNAFLIEHQNEEGLEWLHSALDYMDLHLTVRGEDNLPANGAGRYTFVSNHPLGGIDGVVIGTLLGDRYEGRVRYLLNDLLMNLPGLRPLGVPVNKTGAQNRQTVRLVDEVFQSDNQVILFPAGLCSRLIKGKVQDLPWKKTVIQKSVESHRDIVPMHFYGENSRRFYCIANVGKRLGLKFNIAMLFLVDEVYRNLHQTFELHIGKPIPWQTFDRTRTPQQWAQWLRARVYEL